MKKYYHFEVSKYIIIFLSTALCALIPLDRGYIPPVKDKVAKIPDINYLRGLGYSEEYIKRAIGATGIKKLAVIFVNFPTAGYKTSGSPTINNFPEINLAFSSFTAYYREVSYNQLDIQITFFPSNTSAYMLNNSMESYGTADGADGGERLIRDALSKAGLNVTKPPFDYVMVLHAGYGEETTKKEGDIYSQFITFSPPKNGFSEGAIVPALEKNASIVGVICHEFGHQLGLPDLYNTQTHEQAVSIWCLMDYGMWCGKGANPSHLSIWCKQLLGWVTPEVVNTDKVGTVLQAIEILKEAIKIPVLKNEYFLLEYRNNEVAKFDKEIYSGLLIWHVDDSVGSIEENNININPLRRRVDLKEADYSDPSTNGGDQTDPWPGVRRTFASPYSNSYTGLNIGLTITNFQQFDNAMKFDIYKISATEDLIVKRFVNYPNPTTIGKTTLSIVTSKPTDIIEMKIYNLSGELIKYIPYENIKLTFNQKTTHYYWVYEYTWDCDNESKEKVASGLYISQIKAEDKISHAKIVVIR